MTAATRFVVVMVAVTLAVAFVLAPTFPGPLPGTWTAEADDGCTYVDPETGAVTVDPNCVHSPGP